MLIIPRASPVLLVAMLSAAACGEGGQDRQVEWALVDEPVGTTFGLRAEFGGSSCAGFNEWEVEESASQVEVRAIVTFSGAEEGTADLVTEPYRLRLAEPLGERELLGCAPSGEDKDCTKGVTPNGE